MLYFPGKLLDATGKYMFVFIIAGIEVTTSALVLALGNFFCIKKKPEETHTKEAAAEREELNKSEDKNPEDAKVDSIEVEQFLKDEPEKNGEVLTNPETCVWAWEETHKVFRKGRFFNTIYFRNRTSLGLGHLLYYLEASQLISSLWKLIS